MVWRFQILTPSFLGSLFDVSFLYSVRLLRTITFRPYDLSNTLNANWKFRFVKKKIGFYGNIMEKTMENTKSPITSLHFVEKIWKVFSEGNKILSLERRECRNRPRKVWSGSKNVYRIQKNDRIWILNRVTDSSNSILNGEHNLRNS